MQTLLRDRRPAKATRLHPLAPIHREPRPFGEGLAEPVAASHASSAELARTLRSSIEAADRLLSPPNAKPVGRTPGELAFDGGYRAGLEGRACVAPRFAGPMADDLAAQWVAGFEAGDSGLCEGLARDAWEVSGFEAFEDAEYHDMMCDSPAVPYCFN